MLIIFLLLLLTSCDYSPYVELDIVLQDTHSYEQFSPISYYLEYSNNGKKEKIFLNAGQKSIKLKLKKDGTKVFVATPFNIECPIIGSCYTPGDSPIVYLKEAEGLLSHALLEAYEYNSFCVESINYKILKSKVPIAFDETKFILELTEGDFKKFTKLEQRKLYVSSLPSGMWISARSDTMNLYFPEDKKIFYTLELYPGIYSFYNHERKLELIFSIPISGQIVQQMKSLEL